jgi:hypothetical protein
MGGISELCKIFPIAAVRNVAVMPHTFYDGPGLLAAIMRRLRWGRLTQ